MTNPRSLLWTCSWVFSLAVLAAAHAPAAESKAEWILHEPAGIEWRPSDSLPPGAVVALLEGDPSKEGFFTMRIKMPDGYRVPSHWHSQAERVTVIAGLLNLGHGSELDPSKTRALPAGTYSSMPAKMTHFGYMTGETVLQLSSMGPWTITYVRPEDDPRKTQGPR